VLFLIIVFFRYYCIC